MQFMLPFLGVKPRGNTALSFVYTAGQGYFIAYHNQALIIRCWGKGGSGAAGVNLTTGGGGGGAGGYSRKQVNARRGNVFRWIIDASGNASVISVRFAFTMLALHGDDASGSSGGTGGAASGGDYNQTGDAGANNSGITGGSGGTAFNVGAGGAGGGTNLNGTSGAAPGGGGGGGGGGATPGSGGSGASPRIQFIWLQQGDPIPV